MLSPIELPEAVASDKVWLDFVGRLKQVSLRYLTGGGETSVPDLPTFEVNCEMCNEKKSTVYCDQDKAHLCVDCDRVHHSQSKLLIKHARLPVYHSPFQFGFCTQHSSDKYECVCLACGELLCQLCILVGSHANRSDHPIISTIDAFRVSLGPGSGFVADAEGIVKRSNVSGTFFAVIEKRKQLLEALKQRHALIVQAESNHAAIQHALDKQLRGALETLDRIKKKRVEYLQGLRRESLLLLTIIEWFQAFTVHARLALPPSLWLTFFHRISNSAQFRPLLVPVQTVEPVEVIARYIEQLPRWVTTRVEVQGTVDVVPENLLADERTKLFVPSTQFEWIPPKVTEFDQAEVSPDKLRKNRMAARLEELLQQPQESARPKISIPLPQVVEGPVPLDNVHEFVMQTLAVLAESESRIPYLDFPEVPSESKFQTVSEQPVSSDKGTKLPPATAKKIEQEFNSAEQLRQILYGGPEGFDNAISVIRAAPSSERQDLIRSFMYLYRSSENGSLLEELVSAICVSTVNKIEASSFLVSGISMLVPLTAAFSLTLFPQDSVFLDLFLQDLVTKAISAAQSTPDQTSLAENSIAKFISLICQPSSGIAFPKSIRFLLRTVHEACTSRYSPQVSVGVVSGLFLARIVSPRLIFSSPKTGGEMQAPQIVTLMTRCLHRIAAAAAEGQSAMTKISDDAQTGLILTAISQTNGLMTRAVLSLPPEGLPALTGGLSPKSAAAKIDKKLREYGQPFQARD